LTNEQLEERLKERFKDRTGAILATYRKEYPDAKPFDLLSAITSAWFRQAAIDQATRKAALGAAPAYLYLFAWRTPIFDGRRGAFHSSEIAFVFENADRCVNIAGGLPEALDLSVRRHRRAPQPGRGRNRQGAPPGGLMSDSQGRRS